MKNLAYLSLFFIIISCTTTSLPLKGTYSSDKSFVINKPLEDTWSKCIDLIASKGYAINVIDKSSGLIVTDKTDFISVYTFEQDNGELEDPNAYVVVEKRLFDGVEKMKVKPTSITGNWNIRLKKIDDNNTSVTVNITGLGGIVNGGTSVMGGNVPPQSIPSYSTGVFEKWVSEQLK